MQGQLYRENVKKNIVLKSLLARKAETSVKASSCRFKFFLQSSFPWIELGHNGRGRRFTWKYIEKKFVKIMIFKVKVGPNYGVQYYKGLYVIKIFFRTAMLNMWYDCEIILLQKGHNI